MRRISTAARSPRSPQSGKLSAAERSSLNQALAKALAFRDAGRVPEAREWAAELVKLLKSHDLLKGRTAPSSPSRSWTPRRNSAHRRSRGPTPAPAPAAADCRAGRLGGRGARPGPDPAL